MSQNILGSVTLAYSLLWNQWRKRMGVRLVVEPFGNQAIDGQHLLSTLEGLWSATNHAVVLSVDSPPLLCDLLRCAPAQSLWIEVPHPALRDALLAGLVRKAHQRGVRLMWHGEPGEGPDADTAEWFDTISRTLTPHQALAALRASLRHIQGAGRGQLQTSPIVPSGLYEGLASQALVEHALDHQNAWGVAGWPAEEVIYNYRFRQIQPSRSQLMTLVQGIEADESVEVLEHLMGEEPLLTYRFLRYLNSAALDLGREVSSVREGLMTIGYARLREWLMEQMPHASSDLNLDPIRASMVLRGRIMERLADAGVEDELRREVFLCGIFSQVDLLLGEHLGSALHHLPLPGRVVSAVLGKTGPYAAWLEIASALESAPTRTIRTLCSAHKVEADEVNRALLRSLAPV